MKVLRFFLLAAVLFPALVSCDFYPVTITVRVQDEAGHDRLDPNSEYFIGADIKAVYEGMAYPVEIVVPETKAYCAQFFGLRLCQNWGHGGFYLEFGEFDGSTSQDVTVELLWPDGTSDTIHTRHILFTPLAVANTWRLNGKKVDPPIILVK